MQRDGREVVAMVGDPNMKWYYLGELEHKVPGAEDCEHVAVAVHKSTIVDVSSETGKVVIRGRLGGIKALQSWAEMVQTKNDQTCFSFTTNANTNDLKAPSGFKRHIKGTLFAVLDKTTDGLQNEDACPESVDIVCLCVDTTNELLLKELSVMHGLAPLLKGVSQASGDNSGKGVTTQLFVGTAPTNADDGSPMKAVIDQYKGSTNDTIETGDMLILVIKFDEETPASAAARPFRRIASSTTAARPRRGGAVNVAKLKAELVDAALCGEKDQRRYERAVSAAKPHIRRAASLPPSVHDAAVVLPAVLGA